VKYSDRRPLKLLITGGGTGGHLFPAVAAAQALRVRQPESEVLFVGTHRKIDATTLADYGFASCAIRSYGLKGKNVAELAKALAMLPVSIIQAALAIRRFRPDVALGVGGYVTGPVMAAARFMGVPSVIHEQNSVPGLANRKLGPLVDRVCVSLPDSARFFPSGKTILTGNPVRLDILELAKRIREPGEQLTLLVLGGSQGAHNVNRLVTEALCEHGKGLASRLSVVHQTGRTDKDWVRERYRQTGIQARVAPFFRDMAEVYGVADLLVSRAGATTLSELAVLGKPAILVPYPYAADDHQLKNAAYYAAGGGVLPFAEKELSGEMLAEKLVELTNDPSRLAEMGAAMRRMAIVDAAEKIIDVCLAAAKGELEVRATGGFPQGD